MSGTSSPASNLRKQIENIRLHGVTPVVAINAFETDHPEEIEAVKRIAIESALLEPLRRPIGPTAEKAIELAELVIAAADQPSEFKFLYDLDMPIKSKIETIAKKIYGAENVSYTRRPTIRSCHTRQTALADYLYAWRKPI